MTYEEAKKEFKRRYYTNLYAACRGNVTQMAKRAGKHRMTVQEVVRDMQLGLETRSDARALDRPSAPSATEGSSGSWRKSK